MTLINLTNRIIYEHDTLHQNTIISMCDITTEHKCI